VRYSLLFLSLAIANALPTPAQTAGKFYLEKQVFSRDEPVFLYFRIPNHSPFSIASVSNGNEQPMCSGVAIKVSSDPSAPTASCPFLPDSLCVMNGKPTNSHSGPQPQTKIIRFLLNYQHKIDQPGEYWADADKRERVGDALVSAHAKLRFRIDPEKPRSSSQKLGVWINRLKSPDIDTRLEAARVLASLAPPELENTLLQFAHDPEFARYAPLAFHRLHTHRSLIALANIVRNTPTGSTESLEAANYLAQDGGIYWFPVLQGPANEPARVGYLLYAAEAGGDSIIAELRTLVPGPDRHLEAVEALGWTASRQAIPILLDQLEHTDPLTSDRADESLRMLTHRISVTGSDNRDQHARYLQWSKWWQSEGRGATIFKPHDCGIERPLQP
jgi:hypothetical protein